MILATAETNTSSAWYLLLLVFLMNMGYAIIDALAFLPAYVYENNPAQDVFLPLMDAIHGVKIIGHLTVCTALVPVFLGAVLVNTWTVVKNYYYTNKNIHHTLDIVVNILTSVAATFLIGLMVFSNPSMILLVAPYILVGTTGLQVLYGLFNISKNVRLALQALDREASRHYWLMSSRQALAVGVNAFGLVVTMYLGVQAGEVVSQLGGNLFQVLSSMQTIGVIFMIAKPFFYILFSLVTLGVSLSAWLLSQEVGQSKVKAPQHEFLKPSPHHHASSLQQALMKPNHTPSSTLLVQDGLNLPSSGSLSAASLAQSSFMTVTSSWQDERSCPSQLEGAQITLTQRLG